MVREVFEEDCLESGLGLAFRFDQARLDPVCADVRDSNGQRQRCWLIPDKWQVFRADFRQQVLNRPFGELVVRSRPTEVRIETLAGCTLDLPRVAALLGIPVTVVLPPVEMLPDSRSRAGTWLKDALAAATVLELPAVGARVEMYRDFTRRKIHDHRSGPAVSGAAPSTRGFDYSLYEFTLRDHPLLWLMQRDHLRFFENCRQVLDLGCGAGIFLSLLETAGIPARGLERNPAIASYARGLGFDVEEADAFDFLGGNWGAFDGIYCSHFVEHLDTAGVETLVGLLERALTPGGRAVLVFPDPESIRSQLLGFWRDPEHVRFYHPDLVELMALAHGLDTLWHSHRDGPVRSVIPFPQRASVGGLSGLQPLEMKWDASTPGVQNDEQPGFWKGLRAFLGLAQSVRTRELESRVAKSEEQIRVLTSALTRFREVQDHLHTDVGALWALNQTWAWEDNAVLVMQKPA